jgi:hypothetical protein
VSGFVLSAQERADLLAFFASLTDEALRVDPRFVSPWSATELAEARDGAR